MQDPMRGVLALLEYVHEKFPGLGCLYKNGPGLPPAIRIEQVLENSVDKIIRPECDRVQKEYDFTIWVDFDKKGKIKRTGDGYAPVCLIYLDEPLGMIKMCIEEMGNLMEMPVDIAVDQLRERVFDVLTAKR